MITLASCRSSSSAASTSCAAGCASADRGAADGSVDELSRIVEQIRARWPHTRIVVRGDSDFGKDEIMVWCEGHDVDYVFGYGQNPRLNGMIERELEKSRRRCLVSGKSIQTVSGSALSDTLTSWSCDRRVVAKVGMAAGTARQERPVRGHQHLPQEGRLPGNSTSSCTVPGETWRTGSRTSSCGCSPTARRPTSCGPISSACTSRPSRHRLCQLARRHAPLPTVQACRQGQQDGAPDPPLSGLDPCVRPHPRQPACRGPGATRVAPAASRNGLMPASPTDVGKGVPGARRSIKNRASIPSTCEDRPKSAPKHGTTPPAARSSCSSTAAPDQNQAITPLGDGCGLAAILE